MDYYIKNGHVIIRKHWIILLFKFIQFFLFLLIAGIIYWITFEYRTVFGEDIVHFILFPVIFVLVNYTFIKLILSLIEFYNTLFIVKDDQIIVIKSLLLFKDDIEVLDIYKVTKFDSFKRGIVANMLGYGEIVIEQQRDELRIFHFIPSPHKVLTVLRKHREKTLDDRKRKYIVSDKDGEINDEPIELEGGSINDIDKD